jgi:spermidine synthase
MKGKSSASPRGPGGGLLLWLFALSGGASLAYEVIFARLLGYAFGTSAHAVSTVLAAYMGGLAIGSAAAGRWADRTRRPLRVYAWVELAIGLYALTTPLLMDGVTRGYVWLHAALGAGPSALTAARFSLGVAALIVPTVLMGATMPLVARHLSGARPGDPALVARLYAVNTHGAAVGVLLTNYALLPWGGIWGALGVAFAANVAVFRLALRVERTEAASGEQPDGAALDTAEGTA